VERVRQGSEATLKHSVVYKEQDIYAGWPANHGASQWNNEFLVGFLRGRYKRISMHNIAEPFQRVFSRSLDGGETWELEEPKSDLLCLQPEAPPAFKLDQVILRVCGVYDHGGEECYRSGGFYLSEDHGHEWRGPYAFAGLDDCFPQGMLCTARSRVHERLVYLSAGQESMWGTDYTFCATHDGKEFRFKSVVCEDDARAVMPAVARTGKRLVVALRRRKTAKREGWIDAYGSDDDGASWAFLSQIGVTGSRNGNPPALVALQDGRLVCAYGNRDFGSMVYAISDNGGKTWKSELFREGSESEKDIGYPQLFLRSDGTPVCVYYWADRNSPQQHIAATVLELP
jgi:hypothetical protein